MAELKAERDQIEEERRASAEMLKELQALKEQLAAQQSANNPAPPPDTGSAESEENKDNQ